MAKIDVAALYVDTARGPYPHLPGVLAVGLPDDARLYRGPFPVVAHPSCAPWGVMRFSHGRQQRDSERDGDADCAIFAVHQVRSYGGVLEHPARSSLWKHQGLPIPGEGRDRFGGYTIEVRQVDWGHPCEKKTWLYIVGIPPRDLPPRPPPREPTHVIHSKTSPLPELPKRLRHITPVFLQRGSWKWHAGPILD